MESVEFKVGGLEDPSGAPNVYRTADSSGQLLEQTYGTLE